MKIRILGWVATGNLLLIGCNTMPVVPTESDVQVTRDEPSQSCKNLGPVTGRSNTIRGTTEEAVTDMKTEAFKKGANFVQMETIGAIGTAVRGTAYLCR